MSSMSVSLLATAMTADMQHMHRIIPNKFVLDQIFNQNSTLWSAKQLGHVINVGVTVGGGDDDDSGRTVKCMQLMKERQKKPISALYR
jgi:hypothetical protein